MKFRLIADQRETLPVRVMCDVLGVSPAGYYAWRGRPESLRKTANRALLTEIRRVHMAHRGRYGAPRIYAALRARGYMVSRGRVERLMRHQGIRAITPRRFRVCTGQCTNGKLLWHSENRTRAPGLLPNPGCRPARLVHLHRRILQSSAASFRSRVYHPRTGRAPSRLIQCPPNRGKVKSCPPRGSTG